MHSNSAVTEEIVILGENLELPVPLTAADTEQPVKADDSVAPPKEPRLSAQQVSLLPFHDCTLLSLCVVCL